MMQFIADHAYQIITGILGWATLAMAWAWGASMRMLRTESTMQAITAEIERMAEQYKIDQANAARQRHEDQLAAATSRAEVLQELRDIRNDMKTVLKALGEHK